MWIAFALQKQCKSYSHFDSKTINVFENTLTSTVNKFVINKLVQLTMLWTTGPRCMHQRRHDDNVIEEYEELQSNIDQTPQNDILIVQGQ